MLICRRLSSVYAEKEKAVLLRWGTSLNEIVSQEMVAFFFPRRIATFAKFTRLLELVDVFESNGWYLKWHRAVTTDELNKFSMKRHATPSHRD